MNDISFALPTIAILRAAYFGINGVLTTDFPSNPPVTFNYTRHNISPSLWVPISRTKVKVLEYNATVQLVLHGYSFYVIGQGFGNYNPRTDPLKFNLVDLPRRNTIGVPVSGWTSIRFRDDNPGVWFLHCHIEDHLTWGLTMAFLVKYGHGYWETLEDPPTDLPRC